MSKKLKTLSELREQAQQMGLEISHLGKSRKRISEFLDAEMRRAAASAMTAAETGALTWEQAMNAPVSKAPVSKAPVSKAPVSKAPVSRRRRKKTFNEVLRAHNYVSPQAEARKEEKEAIEAFMRAKKNIPKGMKTVRNPKGYDPNKPVPHVEGTGPRQMMCSHFEWYWDKANGECKKCFPDWNWGSK